MTFSQQTHRRYVFLQRACGKAANAAARSGAECHGPSRPDEPGQCEYRAGPRGITDRRSRARRAASTVAGNQRTRIDAAFAAMTQNPPRALFVAADAYLTSRRNQVIAHVARLRIPAIYPRRHVVAGGLIPGVGCEPFGRHLCRTHSQGREAGRSADSAAHQVRADHQSSPL